jgi:hypothetical protein
MSIESNVRRRDGSRKWKRASCEIIQRGPDGRAAFVNEHGDRAAGTVRGDQAQAPEWNGGRGQGLADRARGNRITWPDGTYWSR